MTLKRMFLTGVIFDDNKAVFLTVLITKNCIKTQL